MNRAAKTKSQSRVSKLRELLQGKGQALIVMQDNPDPDAIAAAVGFRCLAHELAGTSCSIAHGGTVGRAENRALVRYLQLNLRQLEELDLERFDVVVMVDTQPGTGNNSLPLERAPDVVIDHHPMRPASRQVELTDIRQRYGAASTIVYEYLAEAEVTVDVPLATALLFAIRCDTQELGRDTTQADIDAFGALYPLANKRMLGQIQRGRVEREYFAMLATALTQARVFGPCVLTNLGDVGSADMIAEVADILLRDDETTWSICYGFAGDKAYLSVRTSEFDKNAGQVARKLVSRRGSGGGHDQFAGGQIPLRKDTKAEREDIERLIRRRVIKVFGLDKAAVGGKLVPSS